MKFIAWAFFTVLHFPLFSLEKYMCKPLSEKTVQSLKKRARIATEEEEATPFQLMNEALRDKLILQGNITWLFNPSIYLNQDVMRSIPQWVQNPHCQELAASKRFTWCVLNQMILRDFPCKKYDPSLMCTKKAKASILVEKLLILRTVGAQRILKKRIKQEHFKKAAGDWLWYYSGKPDIAKVAFLIAAGAPLNGVPEFPENTWITHFPLMGALSAGSFTAARMLLDAGASMDCTDSLYYGHPMLPDAFTFVRQCFQNIIVLGQDVSRNDCKIIMKRLFSRFIQQKLTKDPSSYFSRLPADILPLVCDCVTENIRDGRGKR